MLAHSVTPPWARTEPIGPSGHHLIFDSFHRTAPYSDDRYHFNFMGARIAHELERDLIEVVPAFGPDLANGLKASGRSARYGDDPTFPHQNTEDYFEWIDLLTAIDRSRTQFTMIEVGAGYGRWISNAAAALKRRKKDELLRLKLVALEANKARFDLMVRNCEQNEIPGSDLRGSSTSTNLCRADGAKPYEGCHRYHCHWRRLSEPASGVDGRRAGDARRRRATLVRRVTAFAKLTQRKETEPRITRNTRMRSPAFIRVIRVIRGEKDGTADNADGEDKE